MGCHRLVGSLKIQSFLQNILSLIGLFCEKKTMFLGSLLIIFDIDIYKCHGDWFARNLVVYLTESGSWVIGGTY